MGLSYGSKISEAVGGSANDAFFASLYDTRVAGGQGVDTLHLSGKSSDWNFMNLANNTTTVNRDGSLGITGSGEIVHKITQQKIHVTGIEKVKFYNPISRSSLNSQLDISV